MCYDTATQAKTDTAAQTNNSIAEAITHKPILYYKKDIKRMILQILYRIVAVGCGTEQIITIIHNTG